MIKVQIKSKYYTMKRKFFHPIIYLFTALFFIFLSCNKLPFKPDYEIIGGSVIGKETCNVDETNDYWLIDFNYYPTIPPKIGDTLVLNGITYTNVLKVKGLAPQLKYIGMKVAIDYNKISKRELTMGCTVDSPIVYNLKEIFIIDQFEIR